MRSRRRREERNDSLRAEALYWEGRALRFASDGSGLRAVCSYGMPRFYNYAIERTQKRALRPWLDGSHASRALDIGCGVGRWSRHLAARGVEVTGVDLSRTMVREATARARRDRVSDRCQFMAGDIAELDLGEWFPLIVSGTVLQHLVDDRRQMAAMRRVSSHLAASGRLVLLEAAPNRRFRGCDGPNFRARTFGEWLRRFEAVGLRLEAVSGVDSTLIKRWVLPRYTRLPRPARVAALALATGFVLPYELTIARRCAGVSWHKVMVFRHANGGRS